MIDKSIYLFANFVKSRVFSYTFRWRKDFEGESTVSKTRASAGAKKDGVIDRENNNRFNRY